MKTFFRIYVLCNYSVILIILWAAIGFVVNGDKFDVTLQPNGLSTPSTSDLHPTTSNDTTSSQQADTIAVKIPSADDHLPSSNSTVKILSTNIPTKDVEHTGQEKNISVDSFKPSTTLSSSTSPSVILSSTTVNTSSRIDENHDTSTVITLPAHRKGKPEGTHVDDEVRDSGPTADYVVPLVIAMLAVPLVGVLCALLYLKGRDFWERRHYGRIDFLWDNRSDSRMDFLIDGMYNN